MENSGIAAPNHSVTYTIGNHLAPEPSFGGLLYRNDSDLNRTGHKPMADNNLTIILDEEKGLLKQPAIVITVLIILYTTVFVVAMFNNCLILTTIYKNQQMRTVINFFLCNLAVADLTVAIVVLPITLFTHIFTGIVAEVVILLSLLTHCAEARCFYPSLRVMIFAPCRLAYLGLLGQFPKLMMEYELTPWDYEVYLLVSYSEWFLGDFLCRTLAYLQGVVVSASVNTLTAVALERYAAICHPYSNIITPKLAVVIVIIIWSIPACVQIPWVVYSTTHTFRGIYGDIMVCFPRFPGYPHDKTFERGFILGGMVLSCYLLPLMVISVLYTLVGLRVLKRSVPGMRGTQAQRKIHLAKVRILRMLMILTVIFAIAWLPLYCIKLYIIYGQPVGVQRKILNRYLIPIAQVLGTANSAINPFVYCYFSEQFRKTIQTLLKSKSFCSWYCYLMAKFYDINQ